MSIIYEALKKVQGKPKFGSNPSSPGPAAALAGAKVVLKKSPAPLAGVIFLIVLLVFGMIFIEARINRQYKPKAQASPAGPVLSSSALPADLAAVPPPPSPSPSESLPKPEPLSNPEPLPQLTLNGIVLSADGNIALINEQILKAGDVIEGALVEEISGNQVVLACQEQKIVLKAK